MVPYLFYTTGAFVAALGIGVLMQKVFLSSRFYFGGTGASSGDGEDLITMNKIEEGKEDIKIPIFFSTASNYMVCRGVFPFLHRNIEDEA